MKRLVAGCALAVGLVFAGAGVANAGEVNGNGDDIGAPDHASSECVFSGLDSPVSVEGALPIDDDFLAVRGNQKNGYHGVQNYGMFQRPLAKELGINEMVPSPGQACRGNVEAPPEG